MITITITTINGYNFNISLNNLQVENVKKRIYKHFKSLSNDDVYKYHVKYQTLVLNTEPLKDDILQNGDVITLNLRSKTEKEKRREERTAALLELIGNQLKADGLIDGFNEMDL